MAKHDRAAAVLRASEDRLRQVYEAVGCGILVRDPSGTIIFANEQAAKIFGIPADQLVGSAHATGVRRYAEDGTELGATDLASHIARMEARPIRGRFWSGPSTNPDPVSSTHRST